jgi:2,4'-dihydroxyacetophenone dioxygenase
MKRPKTTPADAVPEIVATAIPDDDRLWVPQADRVWFRPLMLNAVNGGWTNLLKVTRAGFLSRHRHPGPVHGYVLKGSWRYLEHNWVARAGDYVFEPPGETHTLMVDPGTREMITFFNVSGAMIYLDEQGRQSGYEDVFTKIEMCRKHFNSVGLGSNYVRRFIR